MKVKIGKYIDYIGVYQITSWLPEKWQHKFCDSKIGDKLSDFFQWVHDKRKRTIKIKLDPYDTWSADHTLALIIAPVLKQLKETTNSACMVDYEDGPKEFINTATKENNYEDKNIFKRWDYVLDEMIFSFEHIADDFWEQEFYEKYGVLSSQRKEMEERIANGLRLFGKYYRSLWD